MIISQSFFMNEIWLRGKGKAIDYRLLTIDYLIEDTGGYIKRRIIPPVASNVANRS